jgi:sec-independent protein translocase protein TatB
MFDLGWSELLVVAVLAIIFVGPKDLPKMMRTVGQYVAKARAMAREFQSSFDELARETELDELRREVSALKEQATSPLRSLKDDITKATPTKEAPAAATEPPKPLPLNTDGLTDGIVETIREAEAVEAYGAEQPVSPGEATKKAITGQGKE